MHSDCLIAYRSSLISYLLSLIAYRLSLIAYRLSNISQLDRRSWGPLIDDIQAKFILRSEYVDSRTQPGRFLEVWSCFIRTHLDSNWSHRQLSRKKKKFSIANTWTTYKSLAGRRPDKPYSPLYQRDLSGESQHPNGGFDWARNQVDQNPLGEFVPPNWNYL